MEHEILRNIKTWISFGKNFNEKPKRRKIKDLSDSHLLHIIGYLAITGKTKLYIPETATYFDDMMTYFGKKNSSQSKTENDYEVTVLNETLNMMINEAEYRSINKIFISEYGKWNRTKNAIRTIWNRMWTGMVSTNISNISTNTST